MLGEHRDVVAAVAQRRDEDGNHVEAVVEIRLEPLLADQLRQVAVGRRDHADVDTLRPFGAERLDLAAHFVDQFARRYRKTPLRLADAAAPALTAYGWPGNVRELENTIERAVVMCPGQVIGVKDLGLEPRRLSGVFEVPAPASASSPDDDAVRLPGNLALDEAERRYARAILERCDGNQSAAARLLGISRNKLARLLKA